MNRPTLRLIAAAATLAATALAPAHAARLVLNNVDPPGVGFNDPTPATPEGGNAGTTVGAQRLIAYRKALELWGKTLASDVDIVVRGSFDRLDCTAAGGTLAQAGAVQIFSDFPNAPLAATWYGVALANSIAREDLAPGAFDVDDTTANDDIVAAFNGDVGKADCIAGPGWYYGLDNEPTGGRIDFLNTFMHEVAHGLGFQNFVSETSGNLIEGLPDVYMANTRDLATGQQWNTMTPEQIRASAVRNGKVVWTGPRVTRNSTRVLGPYEGLRLTGALNQELEYGTSSLGPAATLANFNAAVAVAQDGAGASSTDGCEPIANAAALAGRIGLVDRGSCTFAVKVKNLQAAGAVGALIANNNNGAAFSPGGTDAAVTIPVVGISAADGAAIKAAESAGVTAQIFQDPTRRAGVSEGYVRLYAPPTVAPGSTLSHFDTAASPNLLMEPFITDTLVASRNTDLTPSLMADIGWTLETLKIGRCDTHVASALANGQLLHADVSACDAKTRNKAGFLFCMAQVVDRALEDRLLTPLQAGSVLFCSARGKP